MTGPPPGIEKIIESQSKDHTKCPSCGRYVGPLELCPYCRAIHRKRPILVALKYSCPILAILGMILLHHLGATIGNPLVKLEDLDRTSNFAYVQLEGTVCEPPRFYHASGSDDPTAGTMEFCLDDGTGRTRVKTYEDATRRVVRQKKVPSTGDTVHITGNFQTRTHKHSIIVGSPDEIEIRKPPVVASLTAPELAWAEAGDFSELDRVEVTGWVSFHYNDRTHKAGKYAVVVNVSGGKRRDDNGRKRYLRVELPWSRLELEGVISRNATTWEAIPPKGAKLKVTGVVKYQKKGRSKGWRVYPAWASDIEIIEPPKSGDRGAGK